MAKNVILTHQLLAAGIDAVKQVYRNLKQSEHDDPALRFQSVTLGSMIGQPKRAISLDFHAEQTLRKVLADIFNQDIHVVGEESLTVGMAPPSGLMCVLADMIDGTDLFEMGVPLWCSAMIFFKSDQGSIETSIVGAATGDIFFGSRTEDGAWVQRAASNTNERLNGPSDVVDLRHARICSYGQKASRVVGSTKQQKLISRLESYSTGEPASFRYYNFAGNPMMVKLVDRIRGTRGTIVGPGIDAVLDYNGQKPHDVAPGAYIALKAGAYMLDIDSGSEITIRDLGQRLSQPAQDMRYVLAATETLARDTADCVT